MVAPITPRKTFRYRQNIYILEDGIAYRKEVEKVLRRIETVFVGKLVVKHILARGRRLLIIPFVPTKAVPVNAFASADQWLDAMPKGQLDVAHYEIQVPNSAPLRIPAIFEGTGVGSPVTVKYHPATWRQAASNAGHIKPGAGAGEILLHEMLHGLQQMNGVLNREAVIENPHMDGFTEFCAIVTANMYRVERGFSLLRADHKGFGILGKNAAGNDLTKSEVFAAVFADPFAKWFRLQRQFCLELAESRASFNPLKFAALNLGLSVRTTMALPM